MKGKRVRVRGMKGREGMSNRRREREESKGEWVKGKEKGVKGKGVRVRGMKGRGSRKASRGE